MALHVTTDVRSLPETHFGKNLLNPLFAERILQVPLWSRTSDPDPTEEDLMKGWENDMELQPLHRAPEFFPEASSGNRDKQRDDPKL